MSRKKDKNAPVCQYCQATDGYAPAVKKVKRIFGDKHIYVMLCERHYAQLMEMEGGDGCYTQKAK